MRDNHNPLNITAGYVMTWGLIGLCVLAIYALGYGAIWLLMSFGGY